jgi:hypothetical protein
MLRSGMPRHGAISRMLAGAFCFEEVVRTSQKKQGSQTRGCT